MKRIFALIIPIIFCYCGNKDSWDQLDENDKTYIRNLGLLDENETIILFDSQAGFKGIKQSGNFFTDKRMAAYWLEEDSARSQKNFAFYADIDSIALTDKSRALTYSSEIKVFTKNGNNFSVYVDKDSLHLAEFYKGVLKEWKKNSSK